MDKSLDEIVASSRKPGRRTSARRNPRTQIVGAKPVPSPVARARVAAPAPSSVAASTPPPAEKIIVSNLPTDVNETQVKELFHTTVGPCREVTLHYDSNGRSKGVASIQFTRKGDGNQAFQKYNNRLIDGKRPMKIEVVLDPSRIPAPSLVSRVAPAPQTVATPAAAAAAPAAVRRPGGGRGRRGGGRGGRPKTERPNKSAADLDAEMEDYTANNNTAAPAATAA